MDNVDVDACLDDLNCRIDQDVEERLEQEWLAFLEGRFCGDLFMPSRGAGIPARVEWPSVSVNRAQVDLDAMVIQQYGACSGQLASGAGGMMTVRANYGTAILPTLFGAELFVMEEELNTLQTCRPLGADAMKSIVKRGVP